jgi:hypothetical protein
MSRYIDADALKNKLQQHHDFFVNAWGGFREMPIQDKARCDELSNSIAEIFNAPSIDICFCQECKKSHLEGKSTHYLWCTEWGRSTDVFGYCERGEREGE